MTRFLPVAVGGMRGAESEGASLNGGAFNATGKPQPDALGTTLAIGIDSRDVDRGYRCNDCLDLAR